MDKWDCRHLDMAYQVASYSKDPSTQVGCVIVREDQTIASTGFNGFPRFMEDKPERLANREDKNSRTIHAEVNAILNAHGSVDGCTAYVTAPCCTACALVLIQSGIERVVFSAPSQGLRERWGESISKAKSFFEEAEVEMTEVNGY